MTLEYWYLFPISVPTATELIPTMLGELQPLG